MTYIDRFVTCISVRFLIISKKRKREMKEREIELINQCLGVENGERCRKKLPKGKHFCRSCKEKNTNIRIIYEHRPMDDHMVLRGTESLQDI